MKSQVGSSFLKANRTKLNEFLSVIQATNYNVQYPVRLTRCVLIVQRLDFDIPPAILRALCP